jgi:serine/threonine protein kinase
MADNQNSISGHQQLKPEKLSDEKTVRRSQEPADSQIDAAKSPLDSIAGNQSWIPSVPKLQINSAQKAKDPMRLPIGDVYGDFFIRSEIGRGAFGVVYLAEQLSLARTVALKVTDTSQDDGCCVEGKTMAQLEHPSIVRVFAQLTDDVNQRRMLCMQYVSGINLRSLIKITSERHNDQWNGRSLLQILEEDVNEEDLVLRETSVADRNSLIGADKLTAVCWIGAQAAFALDHAHQAGYIHHDVKPENTIIDRFGRPMLVDFNLAMNSKMAGRQIKGGTVPYMSPESLQDFTSKDESQSANAFDADVYALGVMLWELSCGSLPFKNIGAEAFDDPDRLNELLASRQESPNSDRIHSGLGKCLRLAFCFDATRRYPSAHEFGQALLGVANQDLAIESREKNGRLARIVLQRPAICFVAATFVPHVVASGFQIAYNQAQIISQLTPSAYELFNILLFCVNPIAYGIGAAFTIHYLFAFIKPWQRLSRGDPVEADQVELARRNLMLFPKRVAIFGAFGWLGGVFGFPGIIYVLAQRFSIEVWLHFIFSFAISGAIAVTFSYTLVLAVAIYSIYPTLFAEPARFVDESRRQLKPVRASWPTLSMFAGLIPLAAAILVVANFHPIDLLPTVDNPHREFAFKGLVMGLILASAFGFEFIRRIGKSVMRLIDVCVSN